MSGGIQDRESALAMLKAKRAGNPVPPLQFQRSADSSPENVLVPASSPAPSRAVAPPTASKFFGGGMNAPLQSRNAAGGIPSSLLNRPAIVTSNGEGSEGIKAGSPMAIMSSLKNKHKADDQPRASGFSLSYEGRSGDTPDLTETSTASYKSPADFSPESPRPISRLKPKYADASPIKAVGSSPPTPAGAVGTMRKAPSLVQAAQQQVASTKEIKINRLAAQFNLVPIERIREIVRSHPDADGRVHELVRREHEKARLASTSSSPSISPVTLQRTTKLPSTFSSTPLHQTSSTATAISTTTHGYESSFGGTPKQSKTKKNESSKIYANRKGKSGRKKDPDEESEEEADEGTGGSEAESEMDWSGDEGRKKKRRKLQDEEEEEDAEMVAFKAFNNDTAEMLTGTIACSVDQANIIIKHRPYADADEIRTKLYKARGVSVKLFEQYVEIMEGFVQIDACLKKCESIANDISHTQTVWRSASMAQESVVGTPRPDGLNDVKVDVKKISEMLLSETDTSKRRILAKYVREQPRTLSEGTVLKDYQLLGLNWLNLLYSKKIGCILADEMGLGKTIQVIALIAHLAEKGNKGPHMIFVPASTLENWIREFERFAPSIDVQTYYGSQAERAGLRDDLKRQFRRGELSVVLASYTQVASPDDLSFFRKKINFETCIYDEGHKLKSCTTKAYTDLLSIKPRWRLLLTGTPLQNNLQELVSLLMFIHKDIFTDAEPYLRAIFKSQGHANLLSQQRVSKARTMLNPFVLRRRKALVLSLPPKTEMVESCEMTKGQAKIYNETLQRSRKVLGEVDVDALVDLAGQDDGDTKKPSGPAAGKSKNGAAKKKGPMASSGSNILMDLRKAASHPLLFRKKYTDTQVQRIAKACLNTPRWCDANFDYVVEDLEIMSDAEISHFCRESEFDTINKFALKPEAYLEGGKVAALRKIIQRCQKEGKRMLLFSQFVMILDILQVALDHLDVRYTRLDGSTKTDERQTLVDEFNEDPDITVFLLSTKAGGVGINLTAASVVVIYDQDFNPHNDRQAADRAYRIGQEREVEVIKLVTKGSIDEDMLSIGLTKLQLDDAVGGEEVTLDGDATAGKEDKTAKEMKKSLLTTLRNKFEADDGKSGLKQSTVGEDDNPDTNGVVVDDEGPLIDGKKEIKKARGSIAVTKEEDSMKIE